MSGRVVAYMCGRYTLTTADGRLIAERFELRGDEPPPALTMERFNVCPTEPVLVVDAQRRAQVRAWGLATPGSGVKAPINARAETAARRPLFSSLIASSQGRCLVPADGWYEWLRAEKPGPRPVPFHHKIDGGELFAFAGLHVRGTLAILTTEPNEVCARVHDRMPCVLAGPDAEAAWLDAEAGADDLRELLTPVDAARLTVTAASPEVNRAGNEGAALLEPEPTFF